MKQLMDAYTAWKKDPTKANLMTALQASQPVIELAMRSYAGSQDPVALSHARLLALKAIKSYSPARGAQLRTHMLTQMQPLRRLAAQRRFLTHVPEEAQYDMSNLRGEEADLTDQLGREPTEAELADKTGFSLRRIRHLRSMAIPQAESAYAGDIISEVPNPMNEWQDYVYHDLSPIDQKIFEWRTGYNKQPKLGVSDIARKLNLSAGRVTQRANTIAEKLGEGLTLGRYRS